MPISTRLLSLSAAGLIVVSAAQAASAEAVLAPHRAIYVLSLETVGQGSRITGADGEIVFEFEGSKCAGYTVNYRYRTEFFMSGNENRVSDFTASTFENGDHSAFNFSSTSANNGEPDKQTDGEAKREDDAVDIKLVKPEEKKLVIKDPITFPTEHLLLTLDAAARKQLILKANLFEGSDSGEKASVTTTIIGKERSDKDAKAGADKDFPELAELKRWRVTVSYFDKERSTGETTPFYVSRFRLYENGISSDLVLDYKTFKLRGKLTKLEMLPVDSCAKGGGD